MKRHIYVKFDFEVPDGFEKLYNRQLEHERYLLRKDPLGSAVYFDELTIVPKKILAAIIRNQEVEKAEREIEAEQKRLLKKAMAKLREMYPAEEECIRLYFLSDITQTNIAKKKGVSQQMISNLIHRGIKHLKEYVDIYKKKYDFCASIQTFN